MLRGDPMSERFLDQHLIYGSRLQRFVRELLTNSGVFWLFDLVRISATQGLAFYITSVPHWALLGAGVIQAWVISRNNVQAKWWHNFIAPVIYSVIDIALEGPERFIDEPYHKLYWAWVVLMGFAYWFQRYSPGVSIILKSLLLVMLLPASYMLTEWKVATASFTSYWFADIPHLFVLLSTIVLGVVLGVTNIMRGRFENLLYKLAGHFEQIASWTFDSQLIERAYASDTVLKLERVERTVLFMDVRGFTPWSEAHTPQEVVEMVNVFYQAAEPIIRAHNGFKIQMTGDEIMTRFYSPDEALEAALALQQTIPAKLLPYGLSAGIGLHTGDVIEGLVGGEFTRQYGIFGDTVNTAARLQGQAQANEVVISASTWGKFTNPPRHLQSIRRELTVKGKAEPIVVHILKPE